MKASDLTKAHLASKFNPLNDSYSYIYISGRVTGVQYHNKFYFDEVENSIEESLKKSALHLNYVIINPLCLPTHHDQKWSSYMRVCLHALLKSEKIVVLSDFKNSRGALTEVLVAKIIGLPITCANTGKQLKPSYLNIILRLVLKLALAKRN